MLSPNQLQQYLEHVQLSGEALQPSLATLVALHRQHATCIPFANVTIARAPTLLKELNFPHDIPDTSPDGLIKKLLKQKWYDNTFLLALIHPREAPHILLVRAGMASPKLLLECRGGYCFESNNLLAGALIGLGFEVYCVAGRNLSETPHDRAGQLVRRCLASYTELACTRLACS